MGRQLPVATRGDLDELELHHRPCRKGGELSYPTLPWVTIFDARGSQRVQGKNLKIFKKLKKSKFSTIRPPYPHQRPILEPLQGHQNVAWHQEHLLQPSNPIYLTTGWRYERQTDAHTRNFGISKGEKLSSATVCLIKWSSYIPKCSLPLGL